MRFNERDPAFLSDYAEDIEWHTRADEPDAGTHHGLAALRRYVESWLSAFPDLVVEADEYVDAGDWALAVTRLVGSGGTSGAGVDDVYVFAALARGGQFVEMWEYASKEEAVEAVESAREPDDSGDPAVGPITES